MKNLSSKKKTHKREIFPSAHKQFHCVWLSDTKLEQILIPRFLRTRIFESLKTAILEVNSGIFKWFYLGVMFKSTHARHQHHNFPLLLLLLLPAILLQRICCIVKMLSYTVIWLRIPQDVQKCYRKRHLKDALYKVHPQRCKKTKNANIWPDHLCSINTICILCVTQVSLTKRL